MKNQRWKRFIQKMLAGVFTASLMVTGILNFPVKSEAVNAVYEDKIIYEPVSSDEFQELWGTKKAPEENYLFGGWYQDSEGKKSPIKSDVAVTGEVYAKYVPSYVLGVKAQNRIDVTGDSDSADMRLVSSVDSLDYQQVGFKIYLNNNPDKNLTGVSTTKVYDTIVADNISYKPQQTFGQVANYFVVWKLLNIPKEAYNAIIYVRPYWVTCDGTTVEGLGKYVHVRDGIDKIINIPVNINTAQQIAAGIMNISYDNTKLTYKGFEKGRLFEELEVFDKDGTIRCAGNVADIRADKAADTDIYVNLRFTMKEEQPAMIGSGSFLNFKITGESFCNIEEQRVDMTKYIWDIQY